MHGAHDSAEVALVLASSSPCPQTSFVVVVDVVDVVDVVLVAVVVVVVVVIVRVVVVRVAVVRVAVVLVIVVEAEVHGSSRQLLGGFASRASNAPAACALHPDSAVR